jgi:hypothetical protein
MLVLFYGHDIFCDHLSIFYCFGMLYQEKSANPGAGE